MSARETTPTQTSAVPRYPFPSSSRLAVPQEFTRLRADHPIQRVELPYGGEAWLVTRYADVRMVYSDPRFSRAATANADVPRTMAAPSPPGGLLSMDPPDHSRLRRLVSSAFTTKNVDRWRPRTDAIVADLIAGMRAGSGPTDLVEGFSFPLPVIVICELLGVPAEDRAYFRDFSRVVLSMRSVTRQQAESALGELHAYLARHVAHRRALPAGQRSRDLLTDLVEARDDGDRLSEQELVQMGVSILVAGHETTASQLSNFTYTLLQNGLWRELAEQPSLLPSAVEELLRHIELGIGSGRTRIATEDVEVAGMLVRKGEAVIGELTSANHDESVFDRADTIDLRRAPNPHVAFGFGAHYCLGAQLARMELLAGLSGLLRAFPALRFAGTDEDVAWRTGSAVYGPSRLLVAW